MCNASALASPIARTRSNPARLTSANAKAIMAATRAMAVNIFARRDLALTPAFNSDKCTKLYIWVTVHMIATRFTMKDSKRLGCDALTVVGERRAQLPVYMEKVKSDLKVRREGGRRPERHED